MELQSNFISNNFNNVDNIDYIKLNIRTGVTILSSPREIIDPIINFLLDAYLLEYDHNTFYLTVKQNANLGSLFQILNEIREINNLFRYCLQVKLKSKQYPSYIYINKKGKIIIVKQKKRILSL